MRAQFLLEQPTKELLQQETTSVHCLDYAEQLDHEPDPFSFLRIGRP